MVVVIILAKIKLAELLHHASTGDSRRPSSDTSPPRGEPHLDENHCTVGRSYTYKSQISILEKSPGLFFSTLPSPPPFTPLKGLGDNMRAGSQEDGSVLLHCYRDFIQS